MDDWVRLIGLISIPDIGCSYHQIGPKCFRLLRYQSIESSLDCFHIMELATMIKQLDQCNITSSDVVLLVLSNRFVDLTCAESIPRSWCISWLTVCRVSLIKPCCLLLLSLCRRAVVIRQFVQTSSISWWPRWPPTHWWHRWLLRLLRQPCTYSTLCIHCMHTHFSFEECKLATSHSLLACTRVCKDCDDYIPVLAVL